MSRINRAARPDRLTDSDRARMTATLARRDAAIARQQRSDRIARYLIAAVSIALAVAMFYSATN